MLFVTFFSLDIPYDSFNLIFLSLVGNKTFLVYLHFSSSSFSYVKPRRRRRGTCGIWLKYSEAKPWSI